MDKLELLKISENQDVEAYESCEFEEEQNKFKDFKQKYHDFYDDIKFSSNHIKEDW